MCFLAGCAGSPVILPDDEIERVVERFRHYGLAARPDEAATTAAAPSS